jgi:hypothetical protein
MSVISNRKTNKLTISDVIDIRRSSAKGLTSSDLSAMFNIVPRHVNSIITGQRWGNVPQDRIIKNFNNYAITVDGRVYSFTKNDYLTTRSNKNGEKFVDLKKTTRTGKQRKTVSINELVNTHFN